MKTKKDYPAVVISAGLGGLCAAAYLAREGIPVTVVEQHSIPGGYASSFDRAKGRFIFRLHGGDFDGVPSGRNSALSFFQESKTFSQTLMMGLIFSYFHIKYLV